LLDTRTSDGPATLELVFTEKGNLIAQKNDQFKNKGPEFEHPVSLPVTPENIVAIGQYVSLCRQINYITSYGETSEKRKRDYQSIQLLCKIVLSVNSKLAGFEKIRNKADVINDTIPTIYNELVPNAQKAICENLMKDHSIKTEIVEKVKIAKLLNMLREKGFPDDKIALLKTNKSQLTDLYLKYRQQIVVEDIDWFTDREAREEIIHYAERKNMKIAFFFKYGPNQFSFGAKNRAYVDSRALKTLNDRLNEPARTGEDLIAAFNNTTSKIGAGLGLDLTKACLENIRSECGCAISAKYENDTTGMLVMTINLDLAALPQPGA
jgi:hypothetical protein